MLGHKRYAKLLLIMVNSIPYNQNRKFRWEFISYSMVDKEEILSYVSKVVFTLFVKLGPDVKIRKWPWQKKVLMIKIRKVFKYTLYIYAKKKHWRFSLCVNNWNDLVLTQKPSRYCSILKMLLIKLLCWKQTKY